MENYSISQVAERTGFSPSALRFYEESGLVSPDRTPGGYRTYSTGQVDRLSFVRRAKGFGLSLEEISELLQMLEGGRCAPVQDRLRSLVSRNLAETKEKMAELTTFADDLSGFLDSLSGHTPGGACDQSCGCVHDELPDGDGAESGLTDGVGRRDEAGSLDGLVRAAIVAKPVDYVSPSSQTGAPIACSLPVSDVETRLSEWKELASGAVARESVKGGTRLTFPRTVDAAGLVSLVSSENECCSFFRFVVEIDVDAVVLEVTAPDPAQSMIDVLLGSES